MIRRTTLTYTDGTQEIIDHGGKLTGLMYPTKLEDFKEYYGKTISHIKSEYKEHYHNDEHPYVVDYDEDVNPFRVFEFGSEAERKQMEETIKARKVDSRREFLTLHQYNYKSHIKNKL